MCTMYYEQIHIHTQTLVYCTQNYLTCVQDEHAVQQLFIQKHINNNNNHGKYSLFRFFFLSFLLSRLFVSLPFFTLCECVRIIIVGGNNTDININMHTHRIQM